MSPPIDAQTKLRANGCFAHPVYAGRSCARRSSMAKRSYGGTSLMWLEPACPLLPVAGQGRFLFTPIHVDDLAEDRTNR